MNIVGAASWQRAGRVEGGAECTAVSLSVYLPYRNISDSIYLCLTTRLGTEVTQCVPIPSAVYGGIFGIRTRGGIAVTWGPTGSSGRVWDSRPVEYLH